MKLIHENSLKSLYIEMWASGERLGSGTGFLVEDQGQVFLVTNRHNLAGIDAETGKIISGTGAVPEELRIRHNSDFRFGAFVWKSELLTMDGGPLWLEHPVWGKAVDVVALPLKDLSGVRIFKYRFERNEECPQQIMIRAGDRLNVIGFPFGIDAEGTALWLTGTVASEPAFDYRRLPMFLIDCRARKGNSGSAVIAHRPAGSWLEIEGKQGFTEREIYQLVGVYSGRVNEGSDLGMVWKADALKAILRSWGTRWKMQGLLTGHESEHIMSDRGYYLPFSFSCNPVDVLPARASPAGSAPAMGLSLRRETMYSLLSSLSGWIDYPGSQSIPSWSVS